MYICISLHSVYCSADTLNCLYRSAFTVHYVHCSAEHHIVYIGLQVQ